MNDLCEYYVCYDLVCFFSILSDEYEKQRKKNKTKSSRPKRQNEKRGITRVPKKIKMRSKSICINSASEKMKVKMADTTVPKRTSRMEDDERETKKVK